MSERVKVQVLLLFGDLAEIVADVPPEERAEPQHYPAEEIEISGRGVRAPHQTPVENSAETKAKGCGRGRCARPSGPPGPGGSSGSGQGCA